MKEIPRDNKMTKRLKWDNSIRQFGTKDKIIYIRHFSRLLYYLVYQHELKERRLQGII